MSHVGDNDSEYFRRIHGRKFNSLNDRYMLPADDDEVRRSELHHRMIQFVLGGKNYVGPMKEALKARGDQQRRVLDVGTGGGYWAIDIADEFPRVEVTGVDLAPVQPKFELCDLDQWHLPYPSEHFNVIHARSMHIGIHNYPRFLHEVARMLRPGGLVILIETDLEPLADGKFASEIADAGHSSGMPGWFALWKAYKKCLLKRGVDVAVPRHLEEHLQATEVFDKIVTQEGNIPVGFWPKDPELLTIGQLAWMDYDLLLPAMRPMFLAGGIPESEVAILIDNAHQDLYYPVVRPSSRLHIVHAIKKS